MEQRKTAELIFICFTLLQGFAVALRCSDPKPSTLFRELENTVFSERLVRPVEKLSIPINITLGVTLVGILGLDEKSQTMKIVIRQVLEWDINGLSWDEQECGARRVSVPRENLWVPDILINEFVGEDNSPETPYVYLDNTGHVYDDKPINVVSSCLLDIYTFPFDIQNCTLTFGSFLHFAEDVQMVQGPSAEEILQNSRRVLQTNGEWELADISTSQATLLLEGEGYSEIKYHIVLRRRPTLYVVNLLIPSCFLITVDLFSFMLPPHGVDRSSFKMTLILGYTVFLLIMNDLLPVTGETTPLINVFFSISLALMVASLLETIFITHIQFSSGQCGAVPRWLSVLVLQYLAMLVCLPTMKKSRRLTVHIQPPNKESAIKSISGSQNMSDNRSEKNPLGHLDPSSPDLPAHLTQPLLALPPSSPSPPSNVNTELAVDVLRKLSKDLAAVRSHVDKHFQSSSSEEEWNMVGIVVDRLLFFLYIVFILASFISIICIWIWNNSYSA